jgi:hypothetical protein
VCHRWGQTGDQLTRAIAQGRFPIAIGDRSMPDPRISGVIVASP